ncbi:MAG: MCE family protein, partial [Nitrospirae bacterium]
MNLETKVGLFVLLVGVLLFALSTQLEKGEVKEGYVLKVRFDTVDGLEEKAPVRIAGVKVGQVERIDLEEGRALLTLRIEPGVEVPGDSRAELRTEGMLGEKYVAIIPGRDWAHRLAAGGTIGESVSQKSLDELLVSLGKLAADFGKITSSLAEAFGSEEGRQNLQAILQNMRDLTANVKAIVARNDTRVDSIVTHLDSLTTRLDRLVAENQAGVSESVDNFRHITRYTRANLPKWGEDFDRTVNELQAAIAENRPAVRHTVAA